MTALTEPRERRRDPERRQRILDAAAELIAARGFHSVSLADVGAAAGIVGSGVYRHFDSKAAVLVALFDEVIGALSDEAAAAVRSAAQPRAAVRALVAGHVEFALTNRRLLQVYHQEIRNLPDRDRVRLTRKQRRYLDDWVQVVITARPDLPRADALVLVRAAVGAVHSTLFSSGRLPRERTVALLRAAALACLETPPSG